jgi:hypothetical protein
MAAAVAVPTTFPRMGVADFFAAVFLELTSLFSES